MIAHRIDSQRRGSRIAFADSHGAPSHPYTQRSSSCSPIRYAIVALRPRMCRTLRSDNELTLRADSARSLATDVRPLPSAFLSFGQRSLSAQMRHTPRSPGCPLHVDSSRPVSVESRCGAVTLG